MEIVLPKKADKNIADVIDKSNSIVKGVNDKNVILMQIGKKAPNFNWITIQAYGIDPSRDKPRNAIFTLKFFNIVISNIGMLYIVRSEI